MALGLSQREFAELLGISRVHLWRLEKGPHRCPRRQTLLLLRAWLRHPAFRARLAQAGYPHPFPEDN